MPRSCSYRLFLNSRVTARGQTCSQIRNGKTHLVRLPSLNCIWKPGSDEQNVGNRTHELFVVNRRLILNLNGRPIMKTANHISTFFPLPRLAMLCALPAACLLTGCSDPADKVAKI